MSITFSSLVTRLSTAVPAESGSPSAAQYDQAVRDAVSDFNEAATRVKVLTLSIAAGVPTYALPADFVNLVSLKGLTMASPNLLITNAGLVPLAGPLRENVTIEGASLRITPTPAYSLARELWYGAGHVETGTAGSTVYAEMSEREARIILLYAKSVAYGDLASVKVGTVTEYTMGDVRAKFGNAATDLQSSANGALSEYRSAVKAYIGTLVARG